MLSITPVGIPKEKNNLHEVSFIENFPIFKIFAVYNIKAVSLDVLFGLYITFYYYWYCSPTPPQRPATVTAKKRELGYS